MTWTRGRGYAHHGVEALHSTTLKHVVVYSHGVEAYTCSIAVSIEVVRQLESTRQASGSVEGDEFWVAFGTQVIIFAMLIVIDR